MLILLFALAVAVVLTAAVSACFHFVGVGRSDPRTATVWVVIAHGMAWLSLVAVMIFAVPKLKKIFQDFGTELPQLTTLVIGVSDAYAAICLLLPVLLAIDATVFFQLRREDRTKGYGNLWSAMMTTVPVLLLTAVILALAVPLVQLLNDLR